MQFAIDHVTIGAMALDEGVSYLKRQLGIDVPPGGKHPDMSTHNRVARIGDDLFLELIAIDPDVPPPLRRRWFALDEPAQRERLAVRPRPVGWVVRIDDIETVLARSPVDLGPILTMSRGTRTWKLTVTNSGVQPFDGLMPAFIEWDAGPHPAVNMSEAGLTLEAVLLRHPSPRELGHALDVLGLGSLARIERSDAEPSLAFAFRMPDGGTRVVP